MSSNRNRFAQAFAFGSILFIGACGGGGDTAPPVATTLAANSSTSLTAIAGTAVATPPSVVVKDQHGNAMANVVVSFAVASGGGSITGPAQTTNASGIATVGSWTLGSVGANTLSATSGSLAAITFTATGTVGPAASVTKGVGDNQSTLAGDPVGTNPSVTVKDIGGNGVSGATVTFAPGTNGGIVSGGTQTTGTSGTATVGGWRIGAPGSSLLTATVTGLTPVTFTATALDPCQFGYGVNVGDQITWDIHALDCLASDNRREDAWLVTLTATAFKFTMASSAIKTMAELFTNPATGSSRQIGVSGSGDIGTASTTFKAIVTAGNYYWTAKSYTPGEVGIYTTSATSTTESTTNCELMYIMPGVTTSQTIAATDCSATGPFYEDSFWIFLPASTAMTVTMASTAINSYLIMTDINGTEVGRNDNKNGSTNDAEITFTPTTAGFYRILATTATTSVTGAYTLTVK